MLNSALTSALKKQSTAVLGVEDNNLAYFAGELFQKKKQTLVVIAKNHEAMNQLEQELNWLHPKIKVLNFPSWDVQPFDRLSADGVIQAERLKTLSTLKVKANPAIVLTTVNAVSIKIPPLDELPSYQEIKVGSIVDRKELIKSLELCGYLRVGTVMEAGEYSVRGSLLDIYVATADDPVRIDFFDDEIESLKTFSPVTQRTETEVDEVSIQPVSEIVLTEERISNFRQGYREQFLHGANDVLYKDISSGLKNDLMGHYLPLFFKEKLPSFFDVLPEEAVIVAQPMLIDAFKNRREGVEEAYKTRKEFEAEDAKDSGSEVDSYKTLDIDKLYVNSVEWNKINSQFKWLNLQNFDDGSSELVKLNCPAVSLEKTTETAHQKGKVDGLVNKIKMAIKAGETVLLSAFSPSSLVRLEKTLSDHHLDDFKLTNFKVIKKWSELNSKSNKNAGVMAVVSPLAWGFNDVENGLLVITEQDFFGEKNNRPIKRKKRKNEDIISHFSQMEVGGVVVHSEHGIGQFEGLVTLEVQGAKQDFIHLVYNGGDKLYLPAVNLDVLSRYSGDNVALDKLGGAAWQAKKAKLKQQLMDMADELIKTAAKRTMRKGHVYKQPDGLYDEFCAEFPFVPTVEQQAAVSDVEADLYSDRAMDRLVVGDVGFGKTEVALRSAFVAAADGKQVAIVVPTTLLARQHYDVFCKRFANFPFKVAQLSRLVAGKTKKDAIAGLENGKVDIVIGTHAILANTIKFKNLGLLVVDEEQRFGVAHKEKLKSLKSDVDVLTLTATPIPRTLQMSLGGLRKLSLITTPPVDRLAVRNYVMGFDKKVIKEAVLREIFRGGQVFVVSPRVEGLQKLADRIKHLVPDAKIKIAHGQMLKDVLDRTMTDFYDGKFNVLVATTIIESGIDVPRANTLIVHNADKFGLAQLYQIRGRVGRSKVRAYAYFLLPENGVMTDDAVKRLKILQRLEGIGSGFSLASYDMDIRGAGNILGNEQSGHIKEVGFELYNKMLQEAVEVAKAGGNALGMEEASFTPTLNLGVSFMIPENYVADLNTRMSLYRRLSASVSSEDVQDITDEMLDRFGELPTEVSSLVEVVDIKNRCKALNIDKIDVGDKGAIVSFHNKTFAKPDELFGYIMENVGVISMRPDQKVVFHRVWQNSSDRLAGVGAILAKLEQL